MDESKAIELYNFFVKEGYDVNTQEVFLNSLKNNEKASELYDFFDKEGYDLGEKKNFLLSADSGLESGTSVGFDAETFFTPTEDQFAQTQVEQTFSAPEQQITQDIAIQEGKQEQERVKQEQERLEKERLEYIKDETRPEYEALKDRLSKVDIANKPEEKLVPELNYLFEDYG